MKIEVNCSFCNSLLRVEAEHSGKQLRCPVCNNLSQIPLQGENVDDRFSQPPVDHADAQPAFLNPPTPDSQTSGAGNEGLALGIIGIVANLGCGGCLAPFLIILNLIGLYVSFTRKSRYRTAGIITNAIALLLSSLWLLMIFLA